MSPRSRTLVPAALAALCAAAPLVSQTAVDLRRWQTPLKIQGNRNTCITFAAIGALEAAYNRAGYGALDLSEEFQNYVGKVFWLHQTWGDITTADKTENQIGAFGGGGGVGHVRWLANGMRVPAEATMPYQTGGYNLGAHPSYTDPYWAVQRNANTFNLDRGNLPREALTAPRYYRATGMANLINPRSAWEIENVLRAGHEVVWDFYVRGDRSDPIWHADPNAGGGGAHSMLIVGYDRSHANPDQHHFIVKNSWGRTTNPGGYTYIGYDYLQYGYEAGYITGVATPAPWTALAFVGRWNICFDGWRGTLDVTHLPGIAQLWLDERQLHVADRRVGTFYDTSGRAHRVNGRVIGNKLEFWFKGSYPNMRWDDQRESNTGVGRGFNYALVDSPAGAMAGFHQDNAGLIPNPPYGGYARQPSTILGSDGFLSPVFPSSRPNDVLQYLGSWDLRFAETSARLMVERRDDNLVPAAQRGTWAGLQCTLTEGGWTRPTTALVHIASPNRIDLDFTMVDGRQVTTDGLMLTWQRGVFAGAATVMSGTEGIYGVRTGNTVSGNFSSYGTACGGSRGLLNLSTNGSPMISSDVSYRLWSALGQSRGVLNFGFSNRSTTTGLTLPFDLGPLGAPGCWLLTEPVISLPFTSNGVGLATIRIRLDEPSLVGAELFSQFTVLDRSANALGATFSNGVRMRVGG